eukprot:TRINITY_DN4253_c0_g1_i3.p1 TRINITY_DN4253_c0_g1~~TRINITY_DN4253_c0_g1_i3.p1  ORF type:complete len:461 (+),score=189.54 TRINITY_DN4253_c0_g1_i3:98-1384(+)
MGPSGPAGPSGPGGAGGPGSGGPPPPPPCAGPRLCSPAPRVCAPNEPVQAGPAPLCCASCMPPSGRDEATCPQAKMAACQATFNQLPTCAPGADPARNTTSCCLTCRPPPVNPCQQVDCSKMINNIPICAPGTQPAFNGTTCCPNCRLPPPGPQQPTPPPGGRCSGQDVAACMVNTTVCAASETPFQIPGLCCPSCKRPQSQCSPDVVVQCRATARNCTAGETPVVPQGECCLSCKPASPLPPRQCNPACAPDQRCSVVKRSGAFSFVCRKRSVISLTLTIADASRLQQLANFQAPQFRDLVREFLERWCEDNTDSPVCKLLKSADDVDADVLGATKNADGSVTLKIETSAEPVATTDVSGRLSLFDTTDSWSTAISSSATSSYASGGVTVTAVSSTDSGSGTTSAAAGTAPVAALFALVLSIVALFF